MPTVPKAPEQRIRAEGLDAVRIQDHPGAGARRRRARERDREADPVAGEGRGDGAGQRCGQSRGARVHYPTAAPGSPATDAGLVGKTQRTDPVGDVISSITDTTDAGAVRPVTDCAAFSAAMQRPRADDQIPVAYGHREVVWYELSGKFPLHPEVSGRRGVHRLPSRHLRFRLGGELPDLRACRLRLRVGGRCPAGSRLGAAGRVRGTGVRLRDPGGVLCGCGDGGGCLLCLRDQGDELRIVLLQRLQRRGGIGGRRVARERWRRETVHLGDGRLQRLGLNGHGLGRS